MTILDVRTMAEYIGGHISKSINIPLQNISERLDEIRQLPKPLVICCASGMRSNKAVSFLKSQGIECENGGGWIETQEKYRSLEK